jgi:hypothetical protein
MSVLSVFIHLGNIANSLTARTSSSIRLRTRLRPSYTIDNRGISPGTRGRRSKPDSYGEGAHTTGTKKTLETKAGGRAAPGITELRERDTETLPAGLIKASV